MVAFVSVLVPETGYAVINCGVCAGSLCTISDPSLAFVTKTFLVTLIMIDPDAFRSRKGTSGDT